MKHTRSAVMMLVLTLAAVFCLSAAAFAGIFTPWSVREIGDEAFMGVPMQKNYAVRSGIETIGSRAFADTGVQQVWLPATLRFIAPDAFDEGTEFLCSPGTYAESWCLENGVEYNYTKPYLSTNRESVLYGQTAILTANGIYPKEATGYIWETRGRERYWTVMEGETGPTLHYVNTEEEGFIYFRVSIVWGDQCSVPSDAVCIRRYGGELRWEEDKCRAVNGDMAYLQWANLGKDMDYAIYQWAPDGQNPDGGTWDQIDTFTGGYYRTIYGLDPDTAYQFKVVILEDGAPYTESNPITITTGHEKTSFQMREFTVNGTSINMSWEPIHNAVYDVYLGSDPDNLRLFTASSRQSTQSIYNFALNKKSYIKIRARIPNTDYEYWSELIDFTPTEVGPLVDIESWELKGDMLTLSWTPVSGCIYTVYGSLNGGEEVALAENIRRNYVDLGGFKPGDKWSFRVKASAGSWYCVSPEKEVELTEPLNEVEYRALLIGQVTFKGKMYAARNYGSVERIASMLDNVKTPDGTHYSYMRLQDLNRNQILAAIEEAFGGADENDVSLFFIATHGNVSNVGSRAGGLCTVETPEVYGELTQGELAEALGRIKGTKIVWLSCCGSGAGIYDKDHLDEENVADPYYGEYDEDEWGDDWDEYEIDAPLTAGETLDFDIGELRRPDFQVLTAARYRYVSWGDNSENCSKFVYYLTEGVSGPDGTMPADLNGDGLLTQHELFTYIKQCEDDPETGSDQDAQTYPVNSDYVLFRK